MIDLSRRSTASELMDAPETSLSDHAAALADLARLNRVTFTHLPMLAWLKHATRDLKPGDRLSVLDVASGEGDLLRAIHRWGTKRGLVLSLTGLDLNPRSADRAAAATPDGMDITWRTGDVFEDRPDPAPDIIVTSQFTHHLDDDEVVALLFWMERHARRGWCIVDLHRHAFAYYSFPWMARVLRWHRIVRIDGQISIARGFRPEDWRHYLSAAGLTAEVSSAPMYRLRVSRVK